MEYDALQYNENIHFILKIVSGAKRFIMRSLYFVLRVAEILVHEYRLVQWTTQCLHTESGIKLFINSIVWVVTANIESSQSVIVGLLTSRGNWRSNKKITSVLHTGN